MAAADVRKPVIAPPGPPTGGMSQLANGSSRKTPEAAPRVRTLEHSGHVGFDTLPQQLVQKATAQGFVFNVLCVGETGIGKSTMMESLFDMSLDFEPCSYELKTVELRSKTYDVEESGVRIKLTIVETAGFGDQLDKDKSAQMISDYINKQFELYLQEELKIKRCLQLYHDTRIHACIYFISPTGHGLKALDVVTMKELSKRVNILPVIAKADTTSKDELKRFKAKILSELKANGIQPYTFPVDDETVKEQNASLNSQIPFAVVGSTDFVQKNGKTVRARNYPWGIVEVENEEHCDFVRLREALLRINVEDLREKTHRVLYESYRRTRLREMGLKDGEAGPGFADAFDARYRQHKQELKQREAEMKAEFVKTVKQKEDEMKAQEDLVKTRYAEEKKKQDEQLQEVNSQLMKLDLELSHLEQMRAQKTQTIGKKKK